jgi:hypothetical protein
MGVVCPTTGLTEFGGQTLEQVQAHEPRAMLLSWEEFYAARNAAFCLPPVEIDEARWRYALEVLPPDDWCGDSDGESFKCSEATVGDLTACYVRIGHRYWTMTRRSDAAHSSLICEAGKAAGVDKPS